MGCDIHCHIEVKINGQWHHWSAPKIDRDYSLFARMAGVRRVEPSPIAEPRGLPPDISVITEIDWACGDGYWHTPSWLSGAELDALIKERATEAETGAACATTAEERREWYYHPWRSWRRGGFGSLFGGDFTVRQTDADVSRDDLDDHPDGVEDCRVVFWFDS